MMTPAEGIVRTEDPATRSFSGACAAEAATSASSTELRMRLHPLERVVGGRLEYEGEGVAGRSGVPRRGRGRRYRPQHPGAALADETSPDLAVVPCYTGDGEGVAELAELRAADALVGDKVRPQGFLDQQLVFNPGYGVDRNYWKGHFVRELPDELIDHSSSA